MTENERREFLKSALTVLAATTVATLPGCERLPGAMCYAPAPPKDETVPPASVQKDAASPTPPKEVPTDDKAANREDLTEKLKKLGEEEPPEEKEIFSAMCYAIIR